MTLSTGGVRLDRVQGDWEARVVGAIGGGLDEVSEKNLKQKGRKWMYRLLFILSSFLSLTPLY